ncbi:BrnT family toxin [Vibrio harveyi]|uniref:BrnT family toxin n=1 Tax=Vibrio harveyi TaxID=669 RepID=UPI000A634645|nr:BrnT family toxin [Vibrio harveyi]
MEFEWSENKNLINLAKHKIDFSDAVYVFLDASRIERQDTRSNYGEARFQTIGKTKYGILFVIYTDRKASGNVRLISARKASSREKSYERGFMKPYSQVCDMTIKKISIENLKFSRGQADKEQLEALSDKEINEAALSDPDSVVPTKKELETFGTPKERA